MRESIRLLNNCPSLILLCLAIGCSQAPKNLSPPPLDPAAAAAKAMELFDTNSDGKIDKSELSSSPGLKAALKTTDSDRDGALTQQEIQDRLQVYVDSGTAIRSFQVELRRRGGEARNLQLTAVPEPFLEEYIEPATGETNVAGVVTPNIEFTDPEIRQQGYGGMRLGMYRLQVVSLDGKTIPKKYNEDSDLGIEVGLDHHAPLPSFMISY